MEVPNKNQKHFDVQFKSNSGRKRFARIRYFVGGGLAVTLLALAPIGYEAVSLLAKSQVFTPVACNGDWENPQHAEGDPESVRPFVPFSPQENAAHLAAPGQRIFCSFGGSEVSGEVRVALLDLYFAREGEVAGATEEAAPEEVPMENVPVSEVNEEATVELAEPVLEETSTEEVEVEPAPAPEEPSEPVSPAEEPPTSEPVEETTFNFPFRFLFAHAQEEPPVEPAPEEASQPVIQDAPQETLPAEEETTPGEAPPAPAELEETMPVVEETAPLETPPATESSQGEVLGEEAPTRITISYTTDGVLWREAATFDHAKNQERVALLMNDLSEVGTLIIRIEGETLGGDTLYLDGMQLRVSPVQTEELAALALIPVPPAPESLESAELRRLNKEVLLDPEATHRCMLERFGLELPDAGMATTSVLLVRDSSAREDLEIGGTPQGVSVVFDTNDSFLYHPGELEQAVPLRIERTGDAVPGSFSVPVLYTQERRGDDSSVICQLNIVVR